MTVKELINEELINEGKAKEVTKVKINIKNKPYELYIYTITNLKKFLTAETIKKIKEQLKESKKYRCFSNEEINVDNQNEIKLFNIKTENFEDVNINEVFNNDETFKKFFVLSKNIKYDKDSGVYSLFCNSVIDNKKIGDYIVCTPGYVKKKFKIKNLSVKYNDLKGIAIIKDDKLFSKYNKFEENPTITNIDEFKNYLFRTEKNKKEITIATVTKKLLNEIMEETKRAIYKEQIKEIEEIAKETFNTKGSVDVKGDNDFKLSFVLAGVNKSMVFTGNKDEIIEKIKNTDEYKNKQLSTNDQEKLQKKDIVDKFEANNKVENALKIIYQELPNGYIRAFNNSIAVFEKKLVKEQSKEVERIGISNGADALLLMPENNKCLLIEYKSSESLKNLKQTLSGKPFEGAIKLLKVLKNNNQNNSNFGVAVLTGKGYGKILEDGLITRNEKETQINEYTFNNIKYNYLLNGLNGVLFAVSSQEEFKSFLKEVLNKCYALVNKFDTESLKNALSNNLTAKEELIKMAQKEKETKINEEIYQYRTNNKEILKDYVVLYSSLVSLSTLSQFINVNEPLALLKRLEDIAVKAVSKRTNNSYNRLKTKTVYYNNQYQNAASVETNYFNY